MPRFRVTEENGNVIHVDADSEEGVLYHLGNPGTVFILRRAVKPKKIEVETDPRAPYPSPDSAWIEPLPETLGGTATGDEMKSKLRKRG